MRRAASPLCSSGAEGGLLRSRCAASPECAAHSFPVQQHICLALPRCHRRGGERHRPGLLVEQRVRLRQRQEERHVCRLKAEPAAAPDRAQLVRGASMRRRRGAVPCLPGLGFEGWPCPRLPAVGCVASHKPCTGRASCWRPPTCSVIAKRCSSTYTLHPTTRRLPFS